MAATTSSNAEDKRMGAAAHVPQVLVGDCCRLTTYQPCHVEKYHAWMKSPYLREMTRSEPLTLQQEFDMQQEWAQDPNKLTKIILTSTGEMVGDVNLFFSNETHPGLNLERPFSLGRSCEIDIMVAEAGHRRKGIASEACRLMIEVGRKHFGALHFVAKIADNNMPSIRLFSKLGFRQTAHEEVFREYVFEYHLKGSDAKIEAGILAEWKMLRNRTVQEAKHAQEQQQTQRKATAPARVREQKLRDQLLKKQSHLEELKRKHPMDEKALQRLQKAIDALERHIRVLQR